jgi:predicted Zn-dependent protease
MEQRRVRPPRPAGPRAVGVPWPPAATLAPGEYRAYLAPAALEEIVSIITWGGFSAQAIASKGSSLQRLYAGEQSLSPLVSLDEQISGSLSPAFSAEGYPRSDVTLIKAGKAEGQLVTRAAPPNMA